MRFTQTLPTAAASIGVARHALDPLRSRMNAEAWSNLQLLVSEVVTNAVKHVGEQGESDLEVAISHQEDRIRVEVRDAGPGFEPIDRVAGQDEGSGWGLHLVEALSDRWGVEARTSTVWFELRTDAAA